MRYWCWECKINHPIEDIFIEEQDEIISYTCNVTGAVVLEIEGDHDKYDVPIILDQ